MKTLLLVAVIIFSPLATGYTKDYKPAFKVEAKKAMFHKSLKQEIRLLNDLQRAKKLKKIAKNEK